MKRYLFAFLIAAATLTSANAGAERQREDSLPSSQAHEECLNGYSQLGFRVSRTAFFSSRVDTATKASLVSFQAFDGSWMSSIDMNWILRNPTSQIAKLVQLAEGQRKVAYQRLAKFKNQEVVTEADKADKDLMTRTVYVMNTSRPLDTLNNDVRGGIRVVFARSRSEKLPWENDLGRTRPNPRPAAEFGRLYATSNSSPETVVELINSAAQVAANHPEIQDFYFHTSKIHSRLYRRMGLEPDFIDEIDDLNHIWHFDRRMLEATLLKRAKL
ncbi:hypothetical protein BH10BDE1_BH10BDE1_27700 [soil metagenome]